MLAGEGYRNVEDEESHLEPIHPETTPNAEQMQESVEQKLKYFFSLKEWGQFNVADTNSKAEARGAVSARDELGGERERERGERGSRGSEEILGFGTLSSSRHLN